MPKISVIVPSFNHEKYIGAALDSVLSQSVADLEVLVTDDASSDRTAQMALACNDSRVKVEVFPQNRGACAAMNASISRARGEYVALLNSDDMFLPGKLEAQADYLDAHRDVAAVFARPTFVDEDCNPLFAQTKDDVLASAQNRSREAWLRHFFMHGNALCHPTVMIRRACYQELGLYNPALAQIPDLDMWVRLTAHHPIHIIDRPLVAFRIRSGQMNASAPRPEVLARDQWEWQVVLRNYPRFDEELLVRVFPELEDGFGDARRPSVAAKLARHLLERYTGTPPERQGGVPRRPLKWRLAQLALDVGRPAHVNFGLQIMYDLQAELDDPALCREFISLTGAYDTFGMVSGAPVYRKLDR